MSLSPRLNFFSPVFVLRAAFAAVWCSKLAAEIIYIIFQQAHIGE